MLQRSPLLLLLSSSLPLQTHHSLQSKSSQQQQHQASLQLQTRTRSSSSSSGRSRRGLLGSHPTRGTKQQLM
jgi:hypothetical protein